MTHTKEIQNSMVELKELQNHSCTEEGMEHGIYNCCYQEDYKPHKKDCERVRIINTALSALKVIEYYNEQAKYNTMGKTVMDKFSAYQKGEE